MAHEQELNFSDGTTSTLTTQHKSEGNGGNGNGGSKGIQITPFFTKDNIHPFDVINWVKRHAVITNENNENVFEQEDVEFPDNWSQTAVNVVASKYFHGKLGSPERENSVKQLIGRVAKTIAEWGLKDGYFATKDTSDIYLRELTHLLVNQKASFNSPVWFNCGIEIEPQCSACFINAIDDSMESILDLAKIEGMLFKFGSGAGVNLSPLRSSKEKLSTGGISSGPLSFMKGYDSFAGAIKSGGKTRRAAKMVILNADHPDISEFINAKSEEEQKAWALIDSGYDGSFDGEAYSSVFFQNANHSVRVSDDFMQSVVDDANWVTKEVRTGDDFETHKAKELMDQIVNAAHLCGDPGLQFDTTINDWHTCSVSARINASNPCSEYMFIDNTACNLASLNLMKFRNEDGTFNTDAFLHAVRIMIIAQDIIVHNASYPTQEINDNSHAFRTLGLGYANLGALLMANGLPYDSEEGRSYAAVVSSLMTGQAYKTSAEIAGKLSPFPEFGKNKKPMLRVIGKHLRHASDIPVNDMNTSLAEKGVNVWQEALEAGKKYGYRNAQTTVLAPTGTIGFMMDCDTTGIEPDIALLKYKNLVGGGTMKLVNSTISEALKRLGYTHEQSIEIMNHLNEKDTIEGAPHLLEKHLPVFDCAFKPTKGTRSIHYMGHIRMMAAVQPFISGAISKTVNMPNESTPSDIYEAYVEAWKLKLKAVAIYRDGSKRTQPVSTVKESGAARTAGKKPYRRRLDDERPSITHKFSIQGHEGYITVGMFSDGKPGEIFITMAKEGSIISGLMDSFATAISMTLQYGVPLNVLVDKFSHTRFEPSGFTGNRDIPIAKSVLDYIFRWLALKFLTEDERPKGDGKQWGETLAGDMSQQMKDNENIEKQVFQTQSDAPPCQVCGAIMVRNGACYKCFSCGSVSGCS